MRRDFGSNLSPAVKYWIFLVGIITAIFTVIFGSFTASYLNLAPEEQAVVSQLLHKLIPFPFIGSIALVAFICTLVSLLFRYYIIPLLRMAEQTRLITAANPDYRILPEGARELVTLANVINESADAFQTLRRDVDIRIRESSLALKEERNRLAALMSELPHGVLVCNLDGRIMLYNRLAQTMLAEDGDREGSTIGLGRSIFALLDREPLVHALAVMQHGLQNEQGQPALGLMTKLCGTRFIRVNMAPVTNPADDTRTLSGFVLSLEDITGEVAADTERDKLLQKMIDAVQDSLGKLHQGVMTICARPDSDDSTCTNHRQTIIEVSEALEGHLALARQLYSEHSRAYGNRENIVADTLLTLLAKNLSQRFALDVKTTADQGLWLKIDSYGIVQSLTTLAGFLRAEYGVAAIRLNLAAVSGGFARLDIAWSGQDVPTRAIADWQQLPMFMASDGSTDSAGVIIERHGGTVTIQDADPDRCGGIGITLPTALEEHTPRSSAIAPRPISYEFDLFHQPGQEALSDVPLRKLTYVAFDTETTGLNPSEGDEIIQLGAVRIVNGRMLQNECIDQLVNPQRPVPESSVKIHGIDPQRLPSQPLISQVLPKFHAFAADAVLVAHNAAFDMRFLQLKEAQTGLAFDQPVLDTLLLSSLVHPNQDGHSLDAIAERFNIQIVGRHTALGDALVTAEILLKLIPLLEAQGIQTLAEAIAASKKSPFAKIAY